MAALLAAFLALSVGGALAQADAASQFGTTEDAAGPVYRKVMAPTLSGAHLEDLPGFTRSVVRRDHALVTPESQVWAGLPGWSNTQAAYFITPALGAHFTFLILRMAGNASSGLPSPGVERFVFVISGEAQFKYGKKTQALKEDFFAYAPADKEHSLTTGAEGEAVVILVERIYADDPESGSGPKFVVGQTQDQAVVPVPGEVFVLRKLLPATAGYDFNIHIMDFQPGEYLTIKEVHYNQHGLLLLEGRGIYRLADNWYPVQAGDVIWMAPFVPQWYAALGKTRSRYFLYKDTNRDPLLSL